MPETNELLWYYYIVSIIKSASCNQPNDTQHIYVIQWQYGMYNFGRTTKVDIFL